MFTLDQKLVEINDVTVYSLCPYVKIVINNKISCNKENIFSVFLLQILYTRLDHGGPGWWRGLIC